VQPPIHSGLTGLFNFFRKCTAKLDLLIFQGFPTKSPPPVTVSTYQRKISAYADDANMIVKLEYETIVRIKTILEQFGILSGLLCNVDKTTLFPIGQNIQIDNRIRDLGFVIVEKVTVLGLLFDFVRKCTAKLISKMQNSFWKT
jgi:hypothetical protein